MSSKIIEVGTNQKPLCDFLLVINSNWHPISYRFGDITCSLLLKFWTLCIFEPPSAGLGTTYDVRLGLIGNLVVDFLLVIIELFSLDITAEALRAKIDRKLAISLRRGRFDPKFQSSDILLHFQTLAAQICVIREWCWKWRQVYLFLTSCEN